MTHTNMIFCKQLILSLLVMTCCMFRSYGQENKYPEYDTTSEELAAIQRVIDATLPDVETLLKRSGDFKPFAVVIQANDSLAEIDVRDSTKKGYTENDLKEELSIDALKGVYKVIVVFSSGKTTDPATGKETRAVAAFAEHTNDDFAYLFYYPYKVTARKEVVFGDSFGDFAPQVMFKP